MMIDDIKYLIKLLSTVRKDTGTDINETIKYSGNVIFNEYMFSDDVLRLSNKYAPKDTGYMISTAKIIHLDDRIVIKYGAWYSGYVHEIVGNKHEKGKTAKFLEIAFIETCIKYGIYLPYEISVGDFGLELSFSI